MSNSSLCAFTERRKALRPRPYQSEAVDAVLSAFQNGEDFALVQAATGAGKTIIFSLVIKNILHKFPHWRIAVLAHRRELVAQARDKLLKVIPELDYGLACSSLSKARDLDRSVTIGSIQTLSRRSEVRPFDLIIIDEVHRLPTKDKDSQMGRFIQAMSQKSERLHVLGVTATPFRLGHGLIYGQHCIEPSNNWFSRRHYHIDIETLQSEGFLSSYEYMVAEGDMKSDLESCQLDEFGDYDTKDLETRVIKEEHLNSALETLKSHALDRRSIVIFCVSIKHAERLKDVFLANGVLCASVHSEMRILEREGILQDFNEGRIRILTNVGVLTEGWDAPRADCVMLCRPTMSAALYTQMVGRGLRTFPGKRNCLVLDLVGCYERHGSIKAPIVKIPGETEPSVLTTLTDRHCPHCREVIPLRTMVCPHCDVPLGPTVISVDRAKAMVSIEDDQMRLLECDGCQTQYRYDELQLEFLGQDLNSSPLGIWYCPHDHPIKVMEPTRPVNKSGEYQLLGVEVTLEENEVNIRATFLDHQRDPYVAILVYDDSQLETLKSWVKASGGQVRKKSTLTDIVKQFNCSPLKKWPSLTLTLAEDGCLVEFCT